MQLSRPLEWLSAVADPSLRELLASEFADWSPDLVRLFVEGDTPLVARPLFALPPDTRWPRVPGVTLIGDAAHLMPPAGEGANLAMFDGAELACALVEYPDDVEAALGRCEEEMFARSVEAARIAQLVLDMCIGESAPQGFLEMFSG